MLQPFPGFRVSGLAVLAIFVAAPVFASTIYDNGAPDQDSLWAADTSYPYTTVADPFTLSPGANTITGVNWWGDCVTSSPIVGTTCPTGNFTVNVYSNGVGTPGAVLDTYSVGNANQTPTGRNIQSPYNSPEYFYSASIAPLTLTAGTEYWLGISNTTDPSVIWGMEGTTAIPGSHAQYLTAAGWQAEPQDLAFYLTGPNISSVPEPNSIALFGGGLVLLLAVLRRRTATSSR